MKKKLISIVLAALMVVTVTAGCGESEPDAPAVTAAPESKPEAPAVTAAPESKSGTENQTGADVTGDAGNQLETPAPDTPADEPKQLLVLDYGQLDAWINYGFTGTCPSGEGVLMGINANNDYGIIIVTDDSNMTVFGYEGAYERSYDDSVDYGHITISDKVFGFKELSDGVLEIDMGDLGVTRAAVQTQPILMMRLKEIITNYKQ